MVDWHELPVDMEIVDRIRHGPVHGDPSDWRARPKWKRAFLHILDEQVANPPVYPEGSFNGRGIVVCASAKAGWSSGKQLSQGYFPGAWATVHELRRLGCTLPITFAYLGFEEMDQQLADLVAPLGVEVMDLRWLDWHTDHMRILAGWETKVYAIQHAPYEEVLFIDADNVPVRDPTYLFDSPEYIQSGAALWPDLPPYNRKEWVPKVVWESVGMEYQPYQDVESGQLLINKRISWSALNIVRCLNEHSDYWYSMVFGDKTTFFLGWNKIGKSYAMPKAPAGWRKHTILQHDFDGRVIFEHACGDKPTLQGYSHRGYFSHQSHIHGHVKSLAGKWDGFLWHLADVDKDHLAAMKLVAGLYRYERQGLGARTIELLPDGTIGKGADRCEAKWRLHIDGDPAIAIYDVEDMPIAVFREHAGQWHGQWLHFEKCRCWLRREK